MLWIRFIFSLLVILLGCELFTNGIEWFGKRLNVGDGIVGSIFSAVGTCLPETLVPIIAILFSSDISKSQNIGIGAIIGAPFMLSTLSFLVTGISVLVFWKSRNTGDTVIVDTKIFERDMEFFLLVYGLGILASFFPWHGAKVFIACILLLSYVYYIILTIKQDKASQQALEKLYLVRFFDVKPNMYSICAQLALALSCIIISANFFVQNVAEASTRLGVSSLILSLIITPIATELPEKFNSILWISKKKDTLALGNISGAMVFQSCIPVTIGLLATDWKLDNIGLASSFIALLSGFFAYMWVKVKKSLKIYPLLTGGLLYIVFIIYVTTV